MATHIETNTKVAIKVLRKDKTFSKVKGINIIEAEHLRMKTVEGHPNILKSYYNNSTGSLSVGLEHEDVMYNVIELAENGSMSKIIRSTGGLEEDLAKFYFLQICHAIAHIHSFGIVHMDIKLDNILLDEFFNVKVADLGISLDVTESMGFTDSIRGTKCYMPPEVSHLLPSETYDAYKADIYSLGMCLYVMMFGEFPVKENSETYSYYDSFSDSYSDSDTIGSLTGLKISTNIKHQWNKISTELQDLLGNMLSMDPDERPSITEILESDWFKDIYDCSISQDVFEEMEMRKQFMKDHEQNLIC